LGGPTQKQTDLWVGAWCNIKHLNIKQNDRLSRLPLALSNWTALQKLEIDAHHFTQVCVCVLQGVAVYCNTLVAVSCSELQRVALRGVCRCAGSTPTSSLWSACLCLCPCLCLCLCTCLCLSLSVSLWLCLCMCLCLCTISSKSTLPLNSQNIEHFIVIEVVVLAMTYHMCVCECDCVCVCFIVQ